jgi:rod shape-determining protein MreC
MYSRKKKTFSLLLTIIGLIIVFHYLNWLQPFEIFLRRMINPGSYVLYNWSVTLGDETETFNSVEDLEWAYKKIREEAMNDRVDEVELQLLREENASLRESLSFFENTNFETIGADAVGRNIDPVGSSIIIGVGSENGIDLGSPVVVGKGVLVGKVSRVTPKTSVVRLLDDNQSKFAATILNKDSSIGVVEGGYGLSIRMNFIPQNEVIEIGDTVITSGLEEGVPRGLLVGTVETFEKEPYQPFQSAVIAPLHDLGTIIHVIVLDASSN